MSGFDDFFMTRAIANLFGFKGLERDVFFALNYLNHQKKKPVRKVSSVPKAAPEPKPEPVVEKKKEPDLIIRCTKDTYIKSIQCAADYLFSEENIRQDKSVNIEVYKNVKIIEE